MSTHSLLCAIIAFEHMHCNLSTAARCLFFMPQDVYSLHLIRSNRVIVWSHDNKWCEIFPFFHQFTWEFLAHSNEHGDILNLNALIFVGTANSKALLHCSWLQQCSPSCWSIHSQGLEMSMLICGKKKDLRCFDLS